ncbi:FAD-dependent oxidoreductase [Granulosicoccus antarcticus]|uniref:Thioredoxin reductase n=1 Tax=Granulosicoccus antarcticus IMCC3135 TaxID=1192854 RepID=A0A2Z2NVE5_9GAMM|nr:FAD-dependent oxidoreductase [Granulosicoccus antarcticus]ASJ73698.1 Thioredoxin reductase [Granulosicoccus antarcticus IMCC3135]
MESLAEDLKTMIRTPLADEHIEAMRKVGRCQVFEAGECPISLGDPIDTFWYVEQGEIEIVDPATDARYGDSTLREGQYIGDISFLSGGRQMVSARAVCRSQLIGVPRPDMLRLMSRIPELSDRIVTVFAARRRRFLEANDIGLTLLGAEIDRNIRQIAAFADRNRIPVRSLSIGEPEAAQIATRCGIELGRPAVILGKNEVIEEPTPRKIARQIGLSIEFGHCELMDVVIVGGGPSGVAAGVYAGAEGLSALVVEGMAIGGQAGTSSRIENYLGFPTGISGGDLIWRGELQAMKFGTRFTVPSQVTSLKQGKDGVFQITLEDEQVVRAHAVVVATGVQYRRLPIPDLERFEGLGIYYAATSVESRWCSNTDAVIIGGGNSAGQAAMFLSRTVNCVHLLVRGESLAASMSDYLSHRLSSDPRIKIHFGAQMSAVYGDEHLEAIDVLDRTSGQTRRIETRGVFVMVGAAPNTRWLNGCVELDERGFVMTGSDVRRASSYETSHDGIFAVGDVRSGSIKRVASAVGEGSVVISRVWEYVDAHRQ